MNIDDFSDQLAHWEQERYDGLAEMRKNKNLVYSDNIASNTDEDELVRCPRCNSSQITASQKGFGLGKAAAGGLLLGPVGLLGGFFGSRKIVITCLKCGHQWKP